MELTGVARVAACAALLTACGATPTPATHFGNGLTATTIVNAPGAGAREYVTDSTPGESIIGASRVEEVRGVILSAGEASNVRLDGDARLAVLAGWLVERLGPNGELPPARAVQFFARHLGIAEPVWNQFLVGEPTEERFYQALSTATLHYLGDTHDNRYGAATFERGGLTFAVVVLSARHIAIQPLARGLNVGETIHVVGDTLDDYQHPVVAITSPRGSVDEHPSSDATHIDTAVTVSDPGVYQVEILADRGAGATVLANMPVYVGVPIASAMEVAGNPDPGATETASEVEANLLAELNQTRASFGLAALERDARIDEVARAHSTDMRDHNFIAHISPTTGTPVDRMNRAGLASSLVAENLGRAYSSRELHEGLLDSPGHRANILLAGATHVGIGAVELDDHGRRAFIATEVFSLVVGDVDLDAAREEIVRRINDFRRARNLPSVSEDAALSEIAQHAAEAGGSDVAGASGSAMATSQRGLQAVSSRFESVATTVEEVAALAGFQDPSSPSDTRARLVGIGVVKHAADATGRQVLLVVVLSGTPR